MAEKSDGYPKSLLEAIGKDIEKGKEPVHLETLSNAERWKYLPRKKVQPVRRGRVEEFLSRIDRLLDNIMGSGAPDKPTLKSSSSENTMKSLSNNTAPPNPAMIRGRQKIEDALSYLDMPGNEPKAFENPPHSPKIEKKVKKYTVTGSPSEEVRQQNMIINQVSRGPGKVFGSAGNENFRRDTKGG